MEECQCRTWSDLLPSEIEFGNVVGMRLRRARQCGRYALEAREAVW
jgi:hypothetical protein